MIDNKLIAEFMGDVFYKNTGHWYNSEGCDIAWAEDELQYHTSWDWLMPVIKKCQSVCEEPEDLDFGATLFSFYDSLKDVLWWGDANDVYREVVEFINEYNKIK